MRRGHSVSSVPAGRASGRSPRTERWSSIPAMVAFQGPAAGAAAP